MKRRRRRNKQYNIISKFLHEREREREGERDRKNERRTKETNRRSSNTQLQRKTD